MFGEVGACVSDLDKLEGEVRLRSPAKVCAEAYTCSVIDDEGDACVHGVMPLRRGAA